MALKLNTKYLASFVGEDELTGIAPAVNACAKVLHDKTGLGNDFLGWLTLPTDYDKEEFARIQAAAKKIQSNSDILIVIGIGGSYLGARAAMNSYSLRSTTTRRKIHRTFIMSATTSIRLTCRKYWQSVKARTFLSMSFPSPVQPQNRLWHSVCSRSW